MARRPAKAETGVSHIKDLIPDPENRRAHNPRNIGMVVDALQRVGAARSIVIDEDDVVLAGNGVVEAAAEAGITKVRVIEADGHEIIAVRRSGLTADQKRALAIYDNRGAELATWNIEQLRLDQTNGLDLQPFFFPEELKELLASEDTPGRTDPDEVPAERPTDIKSGDLFELGRHRLLCGDSTDKAAVARLLGDTVPFLMVTDPPYGVNYNPQWRNDAAAHGAVAFGASRVGRVANDDVSDWTDAWRLFPGDVAYVWHSSIKGGEIAAHLATAGFQVRAQIIWRKRSFVISRGHYHGQHETCWYTVRKGAVSRWCGDHSQSTVWDIDAVGMSHMKGEDLETNHGTQKPAECMARPIRNHGGPGDLIYDPFVGSGTTIIAAERTERACLAMELTPTYVQMVIDRWEAFTGQTAVKVGDAVET